MCVTVSSGVFFLCRQAKSIECQLRYSIYVIRDARYVSCHVSAIGRHKGRVDSDLEK